MICVTDIMDNYIENGMNNYCQTTITLKYLNKTLSNNIKGDVVELGCFEGDMLFMMKYLLNAYNSDKKLYGYDSFVGLPKPCGKDEYDIEKYPGFSMDFGGMKADYNRLLYNFNSRDLELPIIEKGWFKEIKNYPNTISFAHFDGDLYESIIDSFEKIYDKMSVGGIIVIDDYDWEVTPGVQLATEEFLKDKKENGKVYIEWGKGILVKE